MYRHFLLVVFFTFSITVISKSQSVKFPKVVLADPIEHAHWFDENIEITTTPVFSSERSKEVFLENGYAEHRLKEPDVWLTQINNVVPNSIQIVFTKYPFDKEDWITNYYELLANRLIELFVVDSTLNSSAIEWKLVMQTSCNNEIEAKKMKHGIAISFSKKNLKQLDILEARALGTSVDYTINVSEYKNILPQAQPSEPELIVQPSDLAILYPESINSRKSTSYIPSREKKRDEPECPKFRTKKQKPKRNIWQIIFRR